MLGDSLATVITLLVSGGLLRRRPQTSLPTIKTIQPTSVAGRGARSGAVLAQPFSAPDPSTSSRS